MPVVGTPISLSGNLTIVEHVKAYRQITVDTYDALLTSLVKRSTSLIEKYCNRGLVSRTYLERYDGSGTNNLKLKNYPVTSVTRLATGIESALRIINTSSDAYRAYVEVDLTKLYLTVKGGANDGTEELVLADYPALVTDDGMTELNAAIVALTKGWSVIEYGSYSNWDAEELLPFRGREALQLYIDLEISRKSESDYDVYGEAGIIYSPFGFSRGVMNVLVDYTAGYVLVGTGIAVPDDLEQIAIEATLYLFDQRRTDGGLISEKIGDYSYKKSASANEILPNSLMRRLESYVSRGVN